MKKRQKKKNSKKAAEKYWKMMSEYVSTLLNCEPPVYVGTPPLLPLRIPLRNIGLHLVLDKKEDEKQ